MIEVENFDVKTHLAVVFSKVQSVVFTRISSIRILAYLVTYFV
jgi:hypothetical protein